MFLEGDDEPDVPDTIMVESDELEEETDEQELSKYTFIVRRLTQSHPFIRALEGHMALSHLWFLQDQCRRRL
jgi:hypothetical protein